MTRGQDRNAHPRGFRQTPVNMNARFEYNSYRCCPREEFNGSSTSLSGEMVGGGGSEKSKDGITCCHAGARPIGWASYPSKHYGGRDERKVKHEYFQICNPDN